MRTQSAYKPVFEDYLFHMVLPLAAYAVLAASALPEHSYSNRAFFGVAATAVILLFVGIHNAWDAVTYHVYAISKKRQLEKK
jgi:hypothetical protein